MYSVYKKTHSSKLKCLVDGISFLMINVRIFGKLKLQSINPTCFYLPAKGILTPCYPLPSVTQCFKTTNLKHYNLLLIYFSLRLFFSAV